MPTRLIIRFAGLICWLLGVGCFFASLLFAWYDLDHDQFDDYYTNVWALMGAAIIGSGLFLLYLTATPVLAALALAASSATRQRSAIRYAVAAVAIPLAAVTASTLRPSYVMYAYGDAPPVTGSKTVWLAVAAVVLIASSAFIGRYEAKPDRPLLGLAALFLGIAGYVITFRSTLIRVTDVGFNQLPLTYHPTASLIGFVYLLTSLILLGAAGAAFANRSPTLRNATLVIAISCLLVLAIVAQSPDRFSNTLFPRATPLDLQPGYLGAATTVALAAVAASVATRRGDRSWWTPSLIPWLLAGVCHVVSLLVPWVEVTFAGQAGTAIESLPSGRLGLFSIGRSIPSQLTPWFLIATPVLLALCLPAVRDGTADRGRARVAALALAVAIAITDVVLIVEPARFIPGPDGGIVTHQAALAGVYVSLAGTLLAAASAVLGAGLARAGRMWALLEWKSATHLALAFAAFAAMVSTTWIHATITRDVAGPSSSSAFATPQGVVLMLGAAGLLAAATVVAVAGSAPARLALIGLAVCLAIAETLLLTRPWWLLPDQYGAVLAVPRPYVHATFHPGIWALPALLALTVAIAVLAPGGDRSRQRLSEPDL